MKVWITKYALTGGVFEANVEPSTSSDGMVVLRGNHRTTFDQYFHGEGRDWHRTKAGALQRCIVMANTRTASLKKSLAKNQELAIRFRQELILIGEEEAKPVKKMTKKQLAQLEKESQEQDLADNYAQPYEEPGAN